MVEAASQTDDAHDVAEQASVDGQREPGAGVAAENGEALATHAIGETLSAEAMIEALTQPAALDLPPGSPIEVCQTHISMVFLTATRAYKVKKAIHFWQLVDYRTYEKRRTFCELEVELNQRLAPDLYLGTVPIIRHGSVVRVWHGDRPLPEGAVHLDTAVVMRRVTEFATWKYRIESGSPMAKAEIRDLAHRLIDFHGAHRVEGRAARRAMPLGFARVVQRNFRGTSAAVPDTFPEALHEGLKRRMARRLRRAKRRMRQRASEGRVVDGHGDLRAEHVLRYKGRVVVMDCVEFSTALRHIDPLSDLAFLTMDLIARGRPGVAARLEEEYLTLGGDPDAAALMPLYQAYRAHVRALVDEQTSRDETIDPFVRESKRRDAWRSLVLAWRYVRTGAEQPIIVLHGTSGTGKSVLARTIAPWFGAQILQSDVLRKRIAHMKPTQRPRPDQVPILYGEEMGRKTYATLFEEAEERIAANQAVILDATFLRRESRDAARALAARREVPIVLVNITCDEAEIRRRLRERTKRNDDASDADVAVFEHQLASREPLEAGEETHIPHRSGTPPAILALHLASAIEAQLDPATESLGSHRVAKKGV